MRFLSVCSGIEAASVAWEPLGWEAAAFSEVDAFPSAVLAHRYPSTPNFGDMTRFKEWPDADVDVLVGGTPCQSFSVAGLRAGIADPRGNLALTYIAIADRYAPEWLAWENVPGVFSSSGGEDFRSFVSGLVRWDVPIPPGGWKNAGIVSGSDEPGAYGIAWRVLNAQYFGVPQRRRRVFVVGCSRGWAPAAAVLFEPESVLRNPPPGSAAREDTAPTLAARTGGGGGLGTDAELDGALIPEIGDALRAGGFDASEDGTGRGAPLVPEISPTVTSKWAKGTGGPAGDEAQNLIPEVADPLTSRPYADRGPDSSLIAFQTRGSNLDTNDAIAGTLGTNADRASGGAPMIAHAFDARQSDVIQYGDKTGPLDTEGSSMGILQPAPVAFTASEQANSYAWERDHAPTITAQQPSDTSNIQTGVRIGMVVRRLTPRECERLQGFPDDYTLIQYRKGEAKDGPRYKALGNSMAVPVMRWIGERIAAVDAMMKELRS